MLRTLTPTDPILLLGIVDDAHPDTHHDPAMFDEMVKEFFGFSKKNQYELAQPDKVCSLSLTLGGIEGAKSSQVTLV